MREIENPRDNDGFVQEKHPPGRRVFITNVGYHDYTNLSHWGELIPITRGRLNIKNTDRLEGEIQDLLESNHVSEDDYLCVSGIAYVAILVTGYWFKKFGKINLLYWDAQLQDYRLRVHTFDRRMVG